MGNERNALDRRRFITSAAGAATIAGAATSISPQEANAYAPGGDETRARYRESDHVKAFYRTNGYETKNKT